MTAIYRAINPNHKKLAETVFALLQPKPEGQGLLCRSADLGLPAPAETVLQHAI